ncbi:MAG: hypothetical protein ACRD4B_02690, partial [Acidobacteriota bacterium]
MVLAHSILLVASFLASGILFTHKRILTLIAAAGVIFEGSFLFLTLLDRTILASGNSFVVYLIGSCLFAGAGILAIRNWKWPYARPGSGVRDIAVLLTLIFPLLAAFLVFQYNGYQQEAWVAHGFFNGDTATFTALVHRSLFTDGLVTTNPFAATDYLEYPTLLHAAVATMLEDIGIGLD